MGKIVRRVFIVLLALVAVGLTGLRQHHRSQRDRIVNHQMNSDGSGALTLLSKTHTIDRIYQSMQGPYSNQASLRIVESAEPKLLWLTGLRSKLVNADGHMPISQEFFCHGNLILTPEKINPRRNDNTFTPTPSGWLFTLVPGRLDIALPKGFGIPVYSDEPIDYFSMSLNLNLKTGRQKVRFRTSVDYLADDAPAAAGIRPLFRRAISAYEPVGDVSPFSVCQSSSHPGAACGPFVAKAASNSFFETLGKTNTIHWLVPPGRFESRVPVTDQMELVDDTTAHYVTGHLHPYGKSMALVDATLGQTLFTIHSKDFSDKLGVAEMEELSFPEGVELRKDHEYELLTVYENPTNTPIDAMSILYFYAVDTKFQASRNGDSTVATRGETIN